MSSLREILHNELLHRVRKNPQYSMRSFSRSLGIDVSLISKYLNGKARLGPNSIFKIGKVLSLSLEDVARFQEQSLEERSKNQTKFFELDEDSFRIVCQWHHYMILELLKISDFNLSGKNISRNLDLSQAEVFIALDELKKAGLIEQTETGWRDLTEGKSTGLSDNSTGQEKRHLQKQFREKSLLALEQVPLEKRSHTSLTIAIDAEKIEQVKKMITRFRRELDNVLESQETKSEVYHFNFDFFPLAGLKEGEDSRP